jgi:hypothetical protein
MGAIFKWSTASPKASQNDFSRPMQPDLIIAQTPLVVAAVRQETSVIPIVFVDAGSAAARTQQVAAFRKGLAEAGYQEGQNVSMEFRWAEAH